MENKKSNAPLMAAMSGAILANGEAKAHVRRAQVKNEPKPKAPPRVMDLHSLTGTIRRAKSAEEVDKALNEALITGRFASEKTKRRWTRAAEARKKELVN